MNNTEAERLKCGDAVCLRGTERLRGRAESGLCGTVIRVDHMGVFVQWPDGPSYAWPRQLDRCRIESEIRRGVGTSL